MDYKILDTCLLFPWGLNRGECASWVQAWGSITAIAAATGIAMYQVRKQHNNSIDVISRQKLIERVQLAETLSKIAANSLGLQKHLQQSLSSREKVDLAVSSGIAQHDMPTLQSLERSLENIPLHEIPSSLVSLAMILTTTVRTFRTNVEVALRAHNQMDAAKFDEFFNVINSSVLSLEKTVSDFNFELAKLQNALK